MSDINDSNPEKEYLYRLLQRRYGNRLSGHDFKEVEKGVDGVIKTVAALRSVSLENSDEPMIRFIPYREEQ